MTIRFPGVRGLMAAAALSMLVAGCTSHDTPAANAPPVGVTPPADEPIQGVATPSSVAVVTATNAQ